MKKSLPASLTRRGRRAPRGATAERPSGTDQLSRTELNCLEKEADNGNTLRSHKSQQYSK